MIQYSEIVDELLGKKREPVPVGVGIAAETGGYDALVDELLSAPSGRYEESGEISAITGQPTRKFIGGQPNASWSTYIKAGFVDSPKAMISIFAKDRFPNETKAKRERRYKVVGDEIAYIGDDGKTYFETGDLLTDKLKRFLGMNVARMPAEATSALYASPVTAPVVAPLAAAGAEGVRQLIGKEVFGEEKTAQDVITGMAAEGATSKAGDLIGRAISAFKNKVKMGQGKGLQYITKRDVVGEYLSPDDHARAQLISDIAEQHGIRVATPHLYERQNMINVWKYLRNHPYTANTIQKFEEQLADEVEGAFERQMARISIPEDASFVGEKVTNAAKNIISKAHATRSKATRPLYEKAFKNSGSIDVSHVATALDEMLVEAKVDTGTHKALAHIRKLLNNGKNLEDRLSALDTVKKEIDTIVKNPSTEWKTAIEKGTKIKLLEIKDQLTSAMKEASPDYAHALNVHRLLSPRVEKISDGIIGQLAKRKGDARVVKGVKDLFETPGLTPKHILDIKHQIQAEDPALWDKSLGAYIRGVYGNLKATEQGDVVNVAGKLHKSLFGSDHKRRQMQASMSLTQYRNLSDLMMLFRSVAKTSGKESMTAPFQQVEQDFSKIAGSKMYRYSMFPKQAVTETILGKWNDTLVKGHMDQLLKVLSEQSTSQQIATIKKMSPGSNSWYRALGSLTSLVTNSAMEIE